MKCPDCGFEQHEECWPFNSLKCTKNQLTRLTKENELLRKIADAAEWLDCAESRERPEKYCPLCQALKSRGHAPDCLYSELKAEVISEKP